jgi:hypothetical protein
MIRVHRRLLEAAAVVLDLQAREIAVAPKDDPNQMRGRVDGCVRQGLSRDLIQEELRQGRAAWIRQVRFDARGRPGLKLAYQQSQRFGKAAGSDRRLPQVTDQVPQSVVGRPRRAEKVW